MAKTFKCCICGKNIIGYGNNPYPISYKMNDRCCDECNFSKVIPRRLSENYVEKHEFVFTENGERKAFAYIEELKAKRKEILDAKKDTATDTELPTLEDILSDISFVGIDDDGVYYNCWGVTDNYNADYSLCLIYQVDFV